jgi:ankyrin repeat protein
MEVPPPRLFKLLEAEEPEWVEILEESVNIEQARYVHPKTSLTPLHLAIMAKDTENNGARVAAIRSLLQSDLHGTEVQCGELGYTPLMYACIANDLEHLEYDVPVVKLLLDYNRLCFRFRSQAGHSALDIHIMSMSRLKQQQNTRGRSKGKAPICTSVLKALTEYDLGISLPTSLDLLLACNSLDVLENVAQEEALAFAGRLRDRRKQRTSQEALPVLAGSRNPQNFWVWDFVLVILRSEHEHTYRDIKPVPPFNALHTASQISDFPLPFTMLCMRAYPAQVRAHSIGNKFNLPIHSVAAWETSSDSMVARKSMTLTQLASDHPTACTKRNRQGKTPLALAIETGTAWDSGVRKLTAAQKEDSFIKRQIPGVTE